MPNGKTPIDRERNSNSEIVAVVVVVAVVVIIITSALKSIWGGKKMRREVKYYLHWFRCSTYIYISISGKRNLSITLPEV